MRFAVLFTIKLGSIFFFFFEGQDAYATDQERKLAIERLQELSALVNRCLIRRTSALLTKYLPVKFEMIVCCNLTPIQKQLYQNYINSEVINFCFLFFLCLKKFF